MTADPSASRDAARAARAEAMYRFRRRRQRLLPEARTLLGEPAWDILLDLYLARLRGRQTSIGDACIAADVPHSTALRYIARLEAGGLVVRTGDPGDGRRALIALSDTGRAAIDRLIDTVVQ